MTEAATHFAADDYPIRQLPDIPLWSENYAFTCFAPEPGLGMGTFLGRWSANPHVWREVIALGLPGNRIVCVKNYGGAATAEIASAALLRVEVIEPGATFRLVYDGPACERNREELISTGFKDGRAERLRIDLTFDATTPPWNMSGAGDHSTAIAGALHIEQIGTGAGTVEFGGERFEIRDAFMNRDHSRGARDLSPFRRHCWAQGWFADRRVSFSVYAIEMFGVDGLAMANASVTSADGRFPARVVDIEMIAGLKDERQPYTITLHSELGETTFRRTTTATSLPVAVTAPWDIHHGAVPGTAHALTFEESSTWDWDGCTGIGWSERAFIDQPFPSDK